MCQPALFVWEGRGAGVRQLIPLLSVTGRVGITGACLPVPPPVFDQVNGLSVRLMLFFRLLGPGWGDISPTQGKAVFLLITKTKATNAHLKGVFLL